MAKKNLLKAFVCCRIELKRLVTEIPVVWILAVHTAERDVVVQTVVVVHQHPLVAGLVVVVVGALHDNTHTADARHPGRAAVRKLDVKVVVGSNLRTVIAIAVSNDSTSFCKG